MNSKQRRRISRVKHKELEWVRAGKVPLCLVHCVGLWTLFGEEGYYVPAQRVLFGEPLDSSAIKAFNPYRKQYVWLQACTNEQAAEILLHVRGLGFEYEYRNGRIEEVVPF